MIKTPLSTVIGGAFWTPGTTVIGGNTPTFDQQIQKLFANGEQGFYYDPNDLSTMYQDVAGTAPVTAVGQPVGLIKDKSGKDNHAYQTVSASRPILGRHPTSGLRNLVQSNTNPMGSSWVAAGLTKTGGKLDSRGTYTAVEFKGLPTGVTTVGAKASATDFFTFTVCLKAGSLTTATVFLRNNTTAEGLASCSVNLLTGSVTQAYGGSPPTIKSKSNGFWELTITSNKAVTIGDSLTGYYAITSTVGYDENTSFTADYCQIEKGKSATNIQVTTTAFDTTEAGFDNTYYLYFDGTDDFLQTDSIDFTSTDKMSLFVGVRKLSDASLGMLVELSFDATVSNGFYIATPSSAGTPAYRLATGSPSAHALSTSTFPAPASNVLAASYDKSKSTVLASTKLRVNGTQNALTVAIEGDSLGAFSNSPIYIGRRAGNSLAFNGHIYGLIGVGRLTTDAETKALEKLIAKNTGVTLNV